MKVLMVNYVLQCIVNQQTDKIIYTSAHPSSLKKSILYSQALHISNICTETNEMNKRPAELKKEFLKRSYSTATMIATNVFRWKMNNDQPNTFSSDIHSNFTKVIKDNWSVLKTNNKLKHAFNEKSIIA